MYITSTVEQHVSFNCHKYLVMLEITNIIPNINIGYEIPNIKRLVNTAAHVLGIKKAVHVMPMKLNFDGVAYAVKQGCEFIIFCNKDFLNKDKITNFSIRVIIHEMWHVKQMMDGRLTLNYNNTKAIYNGVEYTNLVEHSKRPFEVEARRAEKIYFDRVKGFIKN